MEKNASICVAGHTGMVGRALLRCLESYGYEKVYGVSRAVADLRDVRAVRTVFASIKPRYIFLSAALAGGIGHNVAAPVEFGRDNALIAVNVLQAAMEQGVERLVYFASSCIYPRGIDHAMSEDALLTGPPEPTNELYALAKIFGVRLCDAYHSQYGCPFFSIVPCNLYGPGDRFDPQHGHVVAGLIERFHRAKMEGTPEVTVWGDGTPRREFLYVDDLAEAAVELMQLQDPPQGHINVGVNEDISIAELAELIRKVVGYRGELRFDPSRPNGIPRKLMDSRKVNQLGWHATTSLRDGLLKTYRWYQQEIGVKDAADDLSPCC